MLTAGKPTKTTYPDGFIVDTYYHPGTGLVKSVGEDGVNRAFAFLDNYDASGKIGNLYTGYNEGSYATLTEYQYGPNTGRLEHIKTTDLDNNFLQYNVYGYDKVDNITEVQRRIAGQDVLYKYEYDNLNRLKSEQRLGGLFPTSLSAYQSLENYFHGPQAHAVSYSDDKLNNQDFHYTYDGNGNLTDMDEWQYAYYYMTRDYNPVTFKSDLYQIKDIHIEYNAENMPISISNWGNLTTFTYDASGARAAKHMDASTRSERSAYYISDAYEVREDSLGNTVVDKYIFAGNQRVAKVVTYWGYNGVELIPRGSNVNYIHKDHLGSTTVVTDDLGNRPFGEPELIQYEPYGLARNGSALSTVTDYAFTDQEFDTSTGFYNYDARLYNPEIGMFITADSMIPSVYDPQSLNRYAYVRNNPMVYIDPSGHQQAVPVKPPDPTSGPVGAPLDFASDAFELLLDTAQEGIGAVGLVDGPIGTAADATNAYISLERENYSDAATYAAGAVAPVASGALIKAGIKVGEKLFETLKEVGKSILGIFKKGGSLTAKEATELESIANTFDTTVDVIGSRAAGKGRNINTNLPVGKGPGTRSDIDVRIDGQVDINTGGALSNAVRNVGNGAGRVSSSTGLPSKPPVIQFVPKKY